MSTCKRSLGHHRDTSDPLEHGLKKPVQVPEDLIKGLKENTVPCRFLYDNAGSQLYRQITQLPEYTPYHAEKRLLECNATDILHSIVQENTLHLVELGVGDGSKTAILVNAALKNNIRVRLTGIDLSSEALHQADATMKLLCPELQDMDWICADYLQGIKTVRGEYSRQALSLLWLGSSMGNFDDAGAVQFLRTMSEAASGDYMAPWNLLLCTDLWKEEAILHAAYDDSEGITRKFIINGMKHALHALHHPMAAEDDEEFFSSWEYKALVNPHKQQVEMSVSPRSVVKDIHPSVDDMLPSQWILMEISRKFTQESVASLLTRSNVCLHASWAQPGYSAQLVLPVKEAFRRSWADTDALFSCITDWEAKPIGLRHPFLFYAGHVAAFARLKLLPKSMHQALDETFSRGIDPIVLDPSRCHHHPKTPVTWPSKDVLLQYIMQVRQELSSSFDCIMHAGSSEEEQMKLLHMVLEHERMHQETICYMLAQQRALDDGGGREHGVVGNGNGGLSSPTSCGAPPPPMASNVFYTFANCNGHGISYADCQIEPQRTLSARGMVFIPGGGVENLGIDPSQPHAFVWDNELGRTSPTCVRDLYVSSPITVAEFARFVSSGGYSEAAIWDEEDFYHISSTGHKMPATWSMSGGGIVIHMPEKSYLYDEVALCPVMVSLAEALAYARWKGARIMTEIEYEHLLTSHEKAAISAGPPCALKEEEEEDGDDGRRNGSSHLCRVVPHPAVNVKYLECHGHEWTATRFAPFPGFKPLDAYRQYSQDFFDGVHYVLKGSSPYTHPSLRRRSFRNFYQKQYPFVFAKFRLVKDVRLWGGMNE